MALIDFIVRLKLFLLVSCIAVCSYACKYFVCIYCILYVCMCVCVSIVSFMYVCFVFALVWKNGIVRAPEVKPLINQSIDQSYIVILKLQLYLLCTWLKGSDTFKL